MNISKQLKQIIPESFKPPLRKALRVYQMIYRRAILLTLQKPCEVVKFKKMKNLKLNVGCGKVIFPRWVNINIEPGS